MFLESLSQFFEDSKELFGKTDTEKVQYILAKGRERIIAKAAEGFKEQYKTFLTKYAEDNIRARLFKQIAVPEITREYAAKGLLSSIKWGDIDVEIASQHATAMRAVAVGIKGIEVTVGAMVKWYQKGPEEGIKELFKGTSEALGEWLIPGWAVYRSAQGLVEALGNYVAGYAFDTSFQAKKHDIYQHDPKTDPKGFAQWVLSLTDIRGFVEREWVQQIGYKGNYFKYDFDITTKEEFGDAMKEAIIAELTKVRAGLIKQQQEFNSVQQKIEARQREYDDKARASNDQLNALTKQALDKAQPYLDKIDQFQVQQAGYKKEDAQAYLQTAESSLAGANSTCAVGLGSKVRQEALTLVYSSITDGSFDRTKIAERFDAYQRTRESQIRSVYDKNSAIATNNLEDACNKETVFKAYGLDQAAIAAEEQVIFLEAAEKAIKLNEKIRVGMDKLKGDADAGQEEYSKAMSGLLDEVQRTLNFPDSWHNPRFFPLFFERQQADTSLIGSGMIYQMYEGLVAMKDQLTQDQRSAASLSQKEAAIGANYAQALAKVRNDFESLVPKGLRVIDGNADLADLFVPAMTLPYPVPVTVSRCNEPAPGADPSSAKDCYQTEAREMPVIAHSDILRVFTDPLAGLEPQPDYGQVRQELDKAISRIEPMADKDFLALHLFKMVQQICDYFSGYTFTDDATEQQKAATKFAAGEGGSYIATMKALWETNQPAMEKARELQKKLGTPYLLTEMEKLKDLVPRKIAFLESFSRQFADQKARTQEQATMAKFNTDFNAIISGQDIKKQHDALVSLQEKLLAEPFKYMTQERDTLAASMKVKRGELEDKLEMLGVKTGGSSGLSVVSESSVAEAIGAMADAYEKQDAGKFFDYVSNSFLGNKASLEEGVRFDLAMFSAISLKIYINSIQKSRDTFVAETRWDKTQTAILGGAQSKTSGKTTFVFAVEGSAVKLKNLRGQLIYATLSPDIAQASGLSGAIVDAIRKARDERNPVQPGAEGDAVAVTAGQTGNTSPQNPSSQPPVPSGGPLMVKDGAIHMLHRSFDFSSGQEGTNEEGDFLMLGGVLKGQGSAQIREVSVDFDSLAAAPSSGYKESVLLADNTTYCFVTRSGQYGKLFVPQGMVIPFTFKYVVQTNGTVDLK